MKGLGRRLRIFLLMAAAAGVGFVILLLTSSAAASIAATVLAAVVFFVCVLIVGIAASEAEGLLGNAFAGLDRVLPGLKAKGDAYVEYLQESSEEGE